MATIEFYVGSAEKHIAVLDDSAVPREGEIVNIRKTKLSGPPRDVGSGQMLIEFRAPHFGPPRN